VSGRRALIAIGENGAVCLFSWTSVWATFGAWKTRIQSISYIASSQLLVVAHEDGAYLVYNLAGEGPFDVLSWVPDDAVEIWRMSPGVQFSGDFLTCHMSFRNASLFFAIIDVTKISKDTSGVFLRRLLDDRDAPYSFFLIGCDLVPTSFCPPFQLDNERVADGSAFIAGIHHVQCQLLGRADADGSVDFLPALTQLMMLSSVAVEEICVRSAIKLLPKVTFAKCQELGLPFVPYDPTPLAVADRMLLSMFVATQPKAMPHEYQRPLFQFLTKTSETTSARGVLALAILLHGFSIWPMVAAKDLYEKMIRGVLHQRHAEFLRQLFCQLVCVESQAFIDVLPGLVAAFVTENRNTGENLTGLFDLYSAAAQKNKDIFGGLLSSDIAKAYHICPQFTELISDVLYCHAKMFDFVDFQRKAVVIGNPDGTIVAFKDGKALFHERITDHNVGLVSVGPECLFAAAVSVERRAAWLVRLAKKGFIRKKKLVVWQKEIQVAAGRVQVVWAETNLFSVESAK
jgi:hypothetical protein